MVAPLVALGPIVTAVGRFAVPYLAKELGKIGTNKFIQTYGNEAFTSLNETLTKNTTMVNPEAMPMVNPNFMSKKDDEETSSLPSIENKQDIPQQEPPEDKEPGLGTEVATEAALQISKNLSKQEDIKSQTEKAVEPKVEFGTLTETEKQTAQALMGDNYSDEARKSFKARHGKNIAKGKTSAAYWADKLFWAGPGGSKKSPPPSQKHTKGT